MPVDAEVVRSLLSAGRMALLVLEQYRSRPRAEILKDPASMFAVLHALQVAIQATIDIGLHVCAALGQLTGETYRDAAYGLRTLDILTVEQSDNLTGMIGVRNVIVHGYTRLDENRILELLTSRTDEIVDLLDTLENALKDRGAL